MKWRVKHLWSLASVTLTLLLGLSPDLAAQQTGTIVGQVTRERDGSPLASVNVSVEGTNLSTITGTDGRYTLQRVPAGPQTLLLRQLGQRPSERAVTVVQDQRVTLDVVLAEQPITLGELVVRGDSRAPERVVEAPAAVTVITPVITRDVSATGQAPRAVAAVPGVDVVQSGMADYNVNARGFNTTLNRRVLVLQDGRDLAVAFLGAQEWSSLAMPTEDLQSMEMIRGPGSALYGANAFSGVLALTTPSARDVIGTKLTVSGGAMPSRVLPDSTGSTLRVDLRHAGVFAGGRFGYRVNLGYQRLNTWSKARTRFDGTDLINEYSEATDSTIPNQNEAGIDEVRPLTGQTLEPGTNSAIGTPDALTNILGSGRLDYYMDNGSVLTLEGGSARATDGVVVTGLGRVQIKDSRRPWVRAAWAAERFNLAAWYSGRMTPDSQVTLSSGTEFRETSGLYHVEGQANQGFANEQGRVVVGGSYRNVRMSTSGTLMAPADDDRSDHLYSAYGQVEYRVIPELRLVGAARYDNSNLYEAQFSPKVGVVYSPNESHAFRLTYNHAFQTPNYSEWFLVAPASAPSTGPADLENGIEGFFTALDANPGFSDLNLPITIPWMFDSLTFARALGNNELTVETIDTWELGYKGDLSDRVFVGIDLFFGEIKNFVTDLLPCVNDQYPCYSLTDEVNVPQNLADISARIDLLESTGQIPTSTADSLRGIATRIGVGYGAVDRQLSPFLATLPTGSRTAIVSYANAGRVLEYGAELGIGARITDEWRADASYGYIKVLVRDAPIDELIPNTPSHRGSLGVMYQGRQGFDGSITFRFSTGYEWAAGVFLGWVPSRQTFDMNLGYVINNNVRVFLSGLNILDQQRFQMYGGSVVGRRILAGVTTTF